MNGTRYRNDIKQFAPTLNFASASFIIKKQWTGSVDASPGFLTDAFEDLAIKIQEKPGMFN